MNDKQSGHHTSGNQLRNNEAGEKKDIDREVIARVVHEAVRAYKKALGEDTLPPWDDAPQWQIKATMAAVEFRLSDPSSTAADQHNQWMKAKLADGWKYGAEKSAKDRRHPMLVPYSQLSESEKMKDRLVRCVIDCFVFEQF